MYGVKNALSGRAHGQNQKIPCRVNRLSLPRSRSHIQLCALSLSNQVCVLRAVDARDAHQRTAHAARTHAYPVYTSATGRCGDLAPSISTPCAFTPCSSAAQCRSPSSAGSRRSALRSRRLAEIAAMARAPIARNEAGDAPTAGATSAGTVAVGSARIPRPWKHQRRRSRL